MPSGNDNQRLKLEEGPPRPQAHRKRRRDADYGLLEDIIKLLTTRSPRDRLILRYKRHYFTARVASPKIAASSWSCADSRRTPTARRAHRATRSSSPTSARRSSSAAREYRVVRLQAMIRSPLSPARRDRAYSHGSPDRRQDSTTRRIRSILSQEHEHADELRTAPPVGARSKEEQITVGYDRARSPHPPRDLPGCAVTRGQPDGRRLHRRRAITIR